MPSKTPQQSAIVDAFAKGESIAVRSVAGSGKTTVLVEALSKTDGIGLCLAFNKKVAVELDSKLPDNIAAKTFNSIGHLAWMQNIRRVVTPDDNKLWNLWRDYPLRSQFVGDQPKEIVALVKAAKVQGLRPDYPPLRGSSDEDWLELAENQDDVSLPHEPLIPAAKALLLESCKLAFAGTVDFADQIYMPCVFSSQFQKFAVLGVDEGQDLTLLQHKMVDKSLALGGQLMVVGDRNQAIYAWRGAESNSFDLLCKRFTLRTLPLTKSFRCPRAVVKEAQRYVPEIEAASDREGTCKRLGLPITPAKNTAFLCRTNAPLLSLAFLGLRRGLPVNFLGRDFMFGLKALYTKCPSEEKLAAWLAETLTKTRSATAKQRAADRAASLSAIIRQGGDVESNIKALCASPKAEAMVLSTIHKAKGLEWPNVVYMDYGKQWSGGQESNVKYVGLTRAMENLMLEELP